MTSRSNTVSEAIPCLKLNLAATNTGSPTTVSFNDPKAVIISTLRDFTDALNQLMEEVNKATAFGGDVANDSGTRAHNRSLPQLVGPTVMTCASGAAKPLPHLGLTSGRSGS